MTAPRTPGSVPDITLAEFMNARLDEDEQVARAAAGWPLPVPPGHDLAFVDDYDQPTRIMDGAAAHIARHDPARVLAEAEAKRRIIDAHSPVHGVSVDSPDYHLAQACSECGYPEEYAVEWPCPTLRLLALPYTAHPDYRAEWSP